MTNVSEISISYKPSELALQHPYVTNSSEAHKVLLPHFNKDTLWIQEQFLVCYLSRGNQVKGVYNGFAGGMNSTIADIRIIFAIALKSGSSGIILAHNHPSGNLEPSAQDIFLTQKIKSSCQLMDIQLLDHLIISPEGSYYSFSDASKL